MGGNALKKVFTRRYLKDEYFKIESEVMGRIETLNTGLRVSGIPAYSTKESFGDMDLMIEYRDGVDYMEIVRSFSPSEVYRNGKVISFDYKELQIDLIITRPEFFDFSLNYYSYNDLGNLMGRIAHKLGLKYGHEGLHYTVRSDNHVLGCIVLTMDSRKAFEVLGYDYDRFLLGFDNILEIYEYTVSSRFFSPDIFKLENRNHRSRVRDNKRPTYRGFLKYCEDNDLGEGFLFDKDKTVYLEYINSHFYWFNNELDVFKEKERKRVLFKGKFNGSLVMGETGLSGKELGQFMSKYKNDDFFEWVISDLTTSELILKRIRGDF